MVPEGGRFVPPLKPACSRDKGPDPYGTAKHAQWLIPSTGYAGGMGASKKTTQIASSSAQPPMTSRRWSSKAVAEWALRAAGRDGEGPLAPELVDGARVRRR